MASAYTFYHTNTPLFLDLVKDCVFCLRAGFWENRVCQQAGTGDRTHEADVLAGEMRGNMIVARIT